MRRADCVVTTKGRVTDEGGFTVREWVRVVSVSCRLVQMFLKLEIDVSTLVLLQVVLNSTSTTAILRVVVILLCDDGERCVYSGQSARVCSIEERVFGVLLESDLSRLLPKSTNLHPLPPFREKILLSVFLNSRCL